MRNISLVLLLLLSSVVWAQTGQSGDKNDLYIEYKVVGGENLRVTKPGPKTEYRGVWHTRHASVQGTARIVIQRGHATRPSISATIKGAGIGEGQNFRWAAPTEDGMMYGGETGQVVDKSFTLDMDFPDWYTGPIVVTAVAAKTGGMSEIVGVETWLDPEPITAVTQTATPTQATGPPQDEPASWTVVVGSAAALAAAAAGLAVLAQRTLRKPGARLPYILQLSHQHLSLAPGETGTVEARAFKVMPSGATIPAGDALITATSSLPATPSQGNGTLKFQVQAPTTSGSYGVDVVATGGDGQATARVSVKVEELSLNAWIAGKKQVRCSADQAPPEVIVYFTGQESQPIEPSFEYGLEGPEIEPAGLLEQSEFFSHAPHQYTSRLKWTGKRQWKNEPISITFRALAKDGREFGDEVTVRPELESHWKIYGYQDEPRVPCRRKVRGIELEDVEFLTDGQDTLPLVALLEPKRSAKLISASIEGPDAELFQLRAAPEDTRNDEGLFAFRLTSKRALQNTSSRGSIRFHIKALVAGTKEELEGEATLLPGFLDLEFAVVPGWKSGTSEVAAVLRLPRHRGSSLRGYPMRLELEGTSATLDEERTTTDSPVYQGTKFLGGRTPAPIGHCASWTLRYSGLSWTSRLELKCFLGDESEPWTTRSIDMTANLNSLLADLLADHDDLRLANPYIIYDNEKGLSYAGEWLCSAMVPEFLSGPFVNVYQGLSSDPNFATYVCGSYSRRIFDWLVARRFRSSIEKTARMNGIEINQFQFAFRPFSHHTAGIHLSGTAPTSDPRFLDPWWRQDWELDSYRRLDGLPTWSSEMMWIGGTLATVGILAVMLAKVWVPAAISAWLAGITAGTAGGTALGGATWGVDATISNVDEDKTYQVAGGRTEVGDWKAQLLSDR